MQSRKYSITLNKPFLFIKNSLVKQLGKAKRSFSSISTPYTEMSRSATEIAINIRLPSSVKHCTVNVTGTEIEITAAATAEQLYRKLTLPKTADTNKITATKKQNMLSINIPLQQ